MNYKEIGVSEQGYRDDIHRGVLGVVLGTHGPGFQERTKGPDAI